MFYKLLEDNTITFGQSILAPTFELYEESHLEYEYPYEGWYYFATSEEANSFFNITESSIV